MKHGTQKVSMNFNRTLLRKHGQQKTTAKGNRPGSTIGPQECHGYHNHSEQASTQPSAKTEPAKETTTQNPGTANEISELWSLTSTESSGEKTPAGQSPSGLRTTNKGHCDVSYVTAHCQCCEILRRVHKCTNCTGITIYHRGH